MNWWMYYSLQCNKLKALFWKYKMLYCQIPTKRAPRCPSKAWFVCCTLLVMYFFFHIYVKCMEYTTKRMSRLQRNYNLSDRLQRVLFFGVPQWPVLEPMFVYCLTQCIQRVFFHCKFHYFSLVNIVSCVAYDSALSSAAKELYKYLSLLSLRIYTTTITFESDIRFRSLLYL